MSSNDVFTAGEPVAATAFAKRKAEEVELASQWQLIRWKFLEHKLAVISGAVLAFLYLVAILAGFIAYGIEHRQHGLLQLLLIGAKRLFIGLDLWVGQFFNFLKTLLRRYAMRQLMENQLPLTTGEVFVAKTTAHLDRSTPARR